MSLSPAHPKTDPVTGEVFNFGLGFFPRPMIRCYRLDSRSRLHGIATIPIPKLGFIHDFALTERHMVFVLGPLQVRHPVGVALGLRSFDSALSYRPEQGTEIVLVPRDGGTVKRFEHDALFHFHVTNAYESGRRTVVDLVAHTPTDGWDGWNGHLRDFRGNPNPAFGGTLTRLELDRDARRVTSTVLNDRGCEFPQLDQRFAATEHRYSYLAEASLPGGEPDSIATVDHRTGDISRYTSQPGESICEPLFAPDLGDGAASGLGGSRGGGGAGIPSGVGPEGRGWLLTLQHQPQRCASRLLVLAADRPAEGPVAVVDLRHHVPMTFHGAFAPASV